MKINYLKEFIKLAKCKSYLEAAEELFISQSALSKHIQLLEKELEVKLFDRTTRQVQLSPYGKLYLPYAQAIVEKYEESILKLNQFKDNLSQTITIGTIPIMAPYGITKEIMDFRAMYPKTNVHVLEADSQQQFLNLENGTCDLAFVREDYAPAELKDSADYLSCVNFSEDRLVAVLPKTHKFAQEKSTKLADLAHESFLFLNEGTFMYDLSINACRKAGFEPVVAYTGKRAENILDLIKVGMGISLLMEKPITYLTSSEVAIVPILPEIKTRINVYRSNKHELTPLTQTFLDFVELRKNNR